MSGATELAARSDVQARRHGQRLAQAMTVASRAYLQAARAVDAGVERRNTAQRRRELTATEDALVERTEAEAWEALFVAAVRFDDVLPDHEFPAAEYVKVLASIHAPAEPQWSLWPCRSEDGTTYPAYYIDGRGRIAALLTDEGEVVRGAWECHDGLPLPMAP